MPLGKCARCEKIFAKSGSNVCAVCEPLEEADFERARQALSDTPNQTAEQLADGTGIELSCILRFLNEGRIRTISADHPVKCGRCGAPAISASKKLCEACLHKLNVEIAEQQAKIKLPKKKHTALGKQDTVHERYIEKRRV